MVAPPRRLFSKAGNSAKRFFTKQTADAVKDAFRKTEGFVQDVKKQAPREIDIALRKTGSTLKEAAPVLSGIGRGVSMAAPALAAVPGIGIGLSGAASGLGSGLVAGSRGAKQLGGLVGDIRRETTGRSGIRAKKPEEEESNDAMSFF